VINAKITNHYAKKLAAQRASHSVPGALDVANDIEVNTE